jgi:hypothetical protein
MDINLDELERARLEVAGKKKHTITFRSKKFTLPQELPLRFAIALGKGDVEAALHAVLNSKVDEFLDLGPSNADFLALANAIGEMYAGREVGESSASGSSSKSTSTRSRRTSSVSTT